MTATPGLGIGAYLHSPWWESVKAWTCTGLLHAIMINVSTHVQLSLYVQKTLFSCSYSLSFFIKFSCLFFLNDPWALRGKGMIKMSLLVLSIPYIVCYSLNHAQLWLSVLNTICISHKSSLMMIEKCINLWVYPIYKQLNGVTL